MNFNKKIFNFSCVQCPLGEVPNKELSICQPIKPIHLDWDSPWAFVPAIFSSVGLLATGAVSAIFIRYNYTPVVIIKINIFYFNSAWDRILKEQKYEN